LSVLAVLAFGVYSCATIEIVPHHVLAAPAVGAAAPPTVVSPELLPS